MCLATYRIILLKNQNLLPYFSVRFLSVALFRESVQPHPVGTDWPAEFLTLSNNYWSIRLMKLNVLARS